VDFTKNARIRCINFNEADLITCFANDYGYEHWLEKALEFYADDGDVTILISSSGKSANMVRAAQYALARGLRLVTFTGFLANNPLKELGQLNFWVDSQAYNVIEMTHHIWLLAVCDLIIGKAEYPASPAVFV
jgi:D-sedoheptulose 7-phosphate isomerase